ncbi:MAG: type IV toxin-antitoxin system AbiEi family antitoxin domain-containing protein [Janthinobacterium lividum]
MSQARLLERILGNGAVCRSSMLIAAGVRPQAIANALKTGLIVRAAPGAYYLAKTEVRQELTDLAAACARKPKAVVCLASAAYLNQLTLNKPEVTWLALPIQAHAAIEGASPERVVRWSFRGAFEVGLVSTMICGVSVIHTDPARTVVDLIRYGRHFGGDGFGIEASRAYLEGGGAASALIDTAIATNAPLRAIGTLKTLLSALRAAA